MPLCAGAGSCAPASGDWTQVCVVVLISQRVMAGTLQLEGKKTEEGVSRTDGVRTWCVWISWVHGRDIFLFFVKYVKVCEITDMRPAVLSGDIRSRGQPRPLKPVVDSRWNKTQTESSRPEKGGFLGSCRSGGGGVFRALCPSFIYLIFIL